MLHYLMNHQEQSSDTASLKNSSIQVGDVIVEGVEIKLDPDTFFKEIDLMLPLKSRSIRSLQVKNAKINSILQQFQVGDLPPDVYLIGDGILKRRIIDTTVNEFRPIVLPRSLVHHILMTAHDHGGHNEFPRMYAAIRWLYYWVGIKRDIQQHCKRCQLCAKYNIAKVKFEKTHFKGARQPMQFISMNLIGEFHPHLDKTTGRPLWLFACTLAMYSAYH